MKDYFAIKKIVLLTVCLMILLTTGCTYEADESNEKGNEYDGIIRFHVVANSDSAQDQDLKLDVRDRLLADMAPELAYMDIEGSRKYIKRNLKMLEAKASEVIKEKGYDYTARAELGIRWVPEKTYGDMYFPAGNYEALNITIGEGEGENWWCVLFPPLCLIDADNSIDYREKAALTEEKGIKIKSKLMEILTDNR